MHILQYPKEQKLLRKPGVLVTPEMVATAEFQNKLKEMIEILQKDGDGIGLAATQIAWSVQLFVLVCDENLNRIAPLVYLNPKILKYSKETEKAEEGCLSFPGLTLEIKRPVQIEWEYQTLSNQSHRQISSGYFARVILHEYEHLFGNLFIDNISSAQFLKVKQWMKIRM